MKTIIKISIVVINLLFLHGISVASESQVITQQLQEHIQTVRSDDFIRINITLSEQFNSQELIRQAQSLQGEARREYVVSVLKDYARLSQEGVVAELNQLQRSKMVEKVTTYWIANVINCYATPGAIKELEKRDDIAGIDYDEYRILLDPNERKNAVAETGNPESREITWNVLKINADDVWALGYNGNGVIVSIIDTGVNYNHSDLEDHVWESAEYPYHGYDFANNDNNPIDDDGHGTHCAGTVAGDGTSGSQTGVAPEATIMCLKVLDANGGGYESSVWSAVEFSVNNGAHVMSLSLGWQHSWGPNRTVWRQTFDNALAAGVIASVAAGNEGDEQGTYPIPDNVRTPGDCPPPWLHPDQTLVGGVSGVICIGSTTSTDAVSYFSGRGPLDWSAVSQYNDYPYSPEMGLIRPDVCAPGSNIKSLAHYSNTGYESGWSGTSMATPANAGMLALMLHKNMNLSPAEISQITEETAYVLQAGKNNTSGSGRIDALAAIEAIPGQEIVYNNHLFNDISGNNNGEIDPDENILLTLALENTGDLAINGVSVEISTESEYITISDNTEYFGNFSQNAIIEKVDAFSFDVANNIPGGEEITFDIVASNASETWNTSFTTTANGVLLTIGNHTFNDASGNNNGILDPGETVDMIIEITNNGQIAATSTIANLTSTDPLITINSGTSNLGDLAAGETQNASFNLSVSSSAPVGSSVVMNLEVESGNYLLEKNYSPKIGLVVEDFETGDFNEFDWEFDGNANWLITSSGTYEGTYSAKSGDISDNQESMLEITLDVSGDDEISFYHKVSSEINYDYLRFYIDGIQQGQWSGSTNWTLATFNVDEGEHTFTWSYEKDFSVSNGDDCAWVDYIEFPATVNNNILISAGPDDEICEDENYLLSGSGTNYQTLQWSTNGSGTFDNPAVLNPGYFPSSQDYQNGNVILTITAYNGGNSATDNMQLTFSPKPEVALIPIPNQCLDWPDFELNQGSPAGGVYSGPGVTDGWFSPATAGAGIHTITYEYTNGNGCTNTAETTVTVENCTYTQNIQLGEGWNIFSSMVMPENPDMLNIVQPIIDEDLLYKVIDENGGNIFFLPFPPPGQWNNSIGNIAATEGYYIKVNAATNLSLTGDQTELPLDIPLTEGWNMISFPAETAQDALAMVQPLIDADVLYKVIDQAGGTILHLPFPPPNGQWSNTIGNFEAGQGYYIKVTADATLTISDPADGYIPPVAKVHQIEPSYFSTNWQNNPYQPMTVAVKAAEWMEPGDEIAVTDQGVCVGTAVYGGIQDDAIIITVGLDDPETEMIDGATPGNDFTFKLWNRNGNMLYENIDFEYLQGSLSFSGLETSVIELNPILTQLAGISSPVSLSLHPNPTNSDAVLNINIPGSALVNVNIIDRLGSFKTSLVTNEMINASGSITISKNRLNLAPGVYTIQVILTENNASNPVIKLLKFVVY